ncbi:hypothetical protein [Mycolicibacterium fortuitum]|uniref:hypothetical protein n=1 Tax=Mycolicibacterium fortuitum TaxID=1766 RepID=UPI00148FAF4C|nr:hypothetical protein [Mycolicibacterium fortuitum]
MDRVEHCGQLVGAEVDSTAALVDGHAVIPTWRYIGRRAFSEVNLHVSISILPIIFVSLVYRPSGTLKIALRGFWAGLFMCPGVLQHPELTPFIAAYRRPSLFVINDDELCRSVGLIFGQGILFRLSQRRRLYSWTVEPSTACKSSIA